MNSQSILNTVEYLFKKYDADKNGKISFSEYQAYLKDTNSNITQLDTSKKLFDEMDQDKSGGLSKEEWFNYLHKALRVAQTMSFPKSPTPAPSPSPPQPAPGPIYVPNPAPRPQPSPTPQPTPDPYPTPTPYLNPYQTPEPYPTPTPNLNPYHTPTPPPQPTPSPMPIFDPNFSFTPGPSPSAPDLIKVGRFSLTKPEFDKVNSIVANIFGKFDRNFDGSLTMDEMNEFFMYSPNALDSIRMLQSMDLNKDGRISREELAAFVISNKLY